MLTIDTYIDKSPGKGMGLFSRCKILKGTIYWRRSESFDNVFTLKELDQFPKIAKDFITKHGFQEKNGNWYLCNDHARFSNHSDNSNTLHEFDSNGLLQCSIASKDIEAGEEILCNYCEICLTCKEGVSFDVI